MRIIVLPLFFICFYTHASSQIGKVKVLVVRQADHLHHFLLEGEARNKPECSKNNKYWMIKEENSVSGKSQWAMLMMAYASGKAVKVTGAGTCSRWKTGEDVNVIQLMD